MVLPSSGGAAPKKKSSVRKKTAKSAYSQDEYNQGTSLSAAQKKGLARQQKAQQTASNKGAAKAIAAADAYANGQWTGATTGGKAREKAISDISKNAVPAGIREKVYKPTPKKTPQTTTKPHGMSTSLDNWNPALAEEDKSSAYDDLLKQILAYTGDDVKVDSSAKMSGNLQDYIRDAQASLPKVAYDALIKAAQKTEAKNSKDINNAYAGFGAYAQGQGRELQADTAAGAEDLKANAKAAADLIAGTSAAGTAANNDAFASIGGLGDTSQTQGAQSAAANQNNYASAIGQRLQASLDNNTSRGLSNVARSSDMGLIGQMQGRESVDNLKQLLAQQTAEYRTSQSQQNAANALQALQMGQSQYNTDRSYAQSATANAQAQQNNQLQLMLTKLGLLDGTDPNSPKYLAAVAQQQAAAAAAAQAQSNTGITQGISAANARSKAIEALQKAGYKPGTDEWNQALKGFGF